MKKSIIEKVIGGVIIFSCIVLLRKLVVQAKNTIENRERSLFKFTSYYNILNHWMDLKKQDKSLAEYFEANHYKTIAIYGMGDLGCHLYEDLKESDIKVLYALDKGIFADHVKKVEIKHLDEELPRVDAVVVTPVISYAEIKKQLEDKCTCPVISLEDIVYSM